MRVKKLSLQCAEVIANRDEFQFESEFKRKEKELGIRKIKNIFIKMLQNPVGVELVKKLLTYGRSIYICDAKASDSFCPTITSEFSSFFLFGFELFHFRKSSSIKEEVGLINLKVRNLWKSYKYNTISGKIFSFPKDVTLFHELRHCLHYFQDEKALRKRIKQRDEKYNNKEERLVIKDGILSEREYLQKRGLPYRDNHGAISFSLSEIKKGDYSRSSVLNVLLHIRAVQVLRELYCFEEGLGLNTLFEDLKVAERNLNIEVSRIKSCLLEFLCSGFINIKELQQVLKSEENILELFKNVRSIKDVNRLKKLLNYVSKEITFRNSDGENILFYLDPKVSDYEKIIKLLVSSYPRMKTTNKIGQGFRETNKFYENLNLPPCNYWSKRPIIIKLAIVYTSLIAFAVIMNVMLR